MSVAFNMCKGTGFIYILFLGGQRAGFLNLPIIFLFVLSSFFIHLGCLPKLVVFECFKHICCWDYNIHLCH